MIEMKINDNILNRGIQQPPPRAQEVYPMPYIPITNPYLHPNFTVPAVLNPINMPLIKKYNINISNVNGDITKIGQIYEDILPASSITKNRYTSLSERMIIHDYFRSVMIRETDGEEIFFDDSIQHERFEINKLLSHLKVMDINPYHFSRLTNNQYRTLPDNMVMFKSCYPIRHDPMRNAVSCARDSVGSHIRIYALNIYDMLCCCLPNLSKVYSDIWREIFYYEQIREDIIRKRQSPNFINMYAYYVTRHSAINFKKLKDLKNRLINKNVLNVMNSNLLKEELFKKEILGIELSNIDHYNIGSIKLSTDSLKKIKTELDTQTDSYYIPIKSIVNKILNSDVSELSSDSDKCIVAVTEAPTENIIDWCTKTYEYPNNPVVRQIMTGYHNIKTWKSIIFQLLAAMYTLDYNKIAINEFSLESNVFIKDLQESSPSTMYWCYKIKGVDYYVPNCGYLLMIDTSFKDLENGKSQNFSNIIDYDDKKIKNTDNINYKIYSDKFSEYTYDNVSDKWKRIAKDNFNRIFNISNFGTDFTKRGGIKPPEEILDIFNKILVYKSKYDNGEIELSDILSEVFIEYMHNKIGEPLNNIEILQIISYDKNFKPGEIVAIKKNDNYYIYGVYIKEIDGYTYRVASIDREKSDETYFMGEFGRNTIYKLHTQPTQTYIPDKKLSNQELIEKYIID